MLLEVTMHGSSSLGPLPDHHTQPAYALFLTNFNSDGSTFDKEETGSCYKRLTQPTNATSKQGTVLSLTNSTHTTGSIFSHPNNVSSLNDLTELLRIAVLNTDIVNDAEVVAKRNEIFQFIGVQILY